MLFDSPDLSVPSSATAIPCTRPPWTRSTARCEDLTGLVITLRDKYRLCVKQDDEPAYEPLIICLLGLRHDIDEIDRALAQPYGFTEEELDFITNYDIKYRMGRDGGGEE